MEHKDIELQLKKVIDEETQALVKLSETVDESWTQAVLMIRDCKGKLIIRPLGIAIFIKNHHPANT
jgi:arabinose-5-phosphate isomerase